MKNKKSFQISQFYSLNETHRKAVQFNQINEIKQKIIYIYLRLI